MKVTHPIKASSEETYGAHFANFVTFIQKKYGKDNCFPLGGIVAFFNQLANRNFVSTTLKTVRSVLREPLRVYFKDFDILLDPWITKIINYVKCRKPRPSKCFPSWNLDLVVRMLQDRQDNDLSFVFKKTLFIVFLACPYRVEEFKSISVSSSSFSPHHISLRTHPLFSSKNQTDTFTPSPIVIQEFEENPTICPVALLNAYMNLTKAMCADRGLARPDQLWIGLNGKPLNKNVIRKWVRDIIFLGDPNAKANGSNVHSIRAQVATHLYAAGVSVKEIITAMNWKSSSTFTRYYSKLGIKSAVQAVLAGHRPPEV